MGLLGLIIMMIQNGTILDVVLHYKWFKSLPEVIVAAPQKEQEVKYLNMNPIWAQLLFGLEHQIIIGEEKPHEML